jgi:uroporphyrinogen decarboxylase
MDLARLKKEFGRDLVFWGGIDTQDLLPFGTPERVKKETREVIRILGEGDGYVIAPSQAIMHDVPLPNVMAFLEAVVEERQARTGMLP